MRSASSSLVLLHRRELRARKQRGSARDILIAEYRWTLLGRLYGWFRAYSTSRSFDDLVMEFER